MNRFPKSHVMGPFAVVTRVNVGRIPKKTQPLTKIGGVIQADYKQKSAEDTNIRNVPQTKIVSGIGNASIAYDTKAMKKQKLLSVNHSEVSFSYSSF